MVLEELKPILSLVWVVWELSVECQELVPGPVQEPELLVQMQVLVPQEQVTQLELGELVQQVQVQQAQVLELVLLKQTHLPN